MLTFLNVDGFGDVPPLPAGGTGAVHYSHVLQRLQMKNCQTIDPADLSHHPICISVFPVGAEAYAEVLKRRTVFVDV